MFSGRLAGLELQLPDVLAVPATSASKCELLNGPIHCRFQACQDVLAGQAVRTELLCGSLERIPACKSVV